MNALDNRLTDDVAQLVAKHRPQRVAAAFTAVGDDFGIQGALEEVVHRCALDDQRPSLRLSDGGRK